MRLASGQESETIHAVCYAVLNEIVDAFGLAKKFGPSADREFTLGRLWTE